MGMFKNLGGAAVFASAFALTQANAGAFGDCSADELTCAYYADHSMCITWPDECFSLTGGFDTQQEIDEYCQDWTNFLQCPGVDLVGELDGNCGKCIYVP